MTDALPPIPVLIHLVFAISALVLGPFALRSRKGTPRHRGMGYAWVFAMIAAAVSSLFLLDHSRPNFHGYTANHLLALATFAGIGRGLWEVAHHRIARHRQAMWGTYIGGCLLAGAFAFSPDRLLGQWLWQATLG